MATMGYPHHLLKMKKWRWESSYKRGVTQFATWNGQSVNKLYIKYYLQAHSANLVFSTGVKSGWTGWSQGDLGKGATTCGTPLCISASKKMKFILLQQQMRGIQVQNYVGIITHQKQVWKTIKEKIVSLGIHPCGNRHIFSYLWNILLKMCALSPNQKDDVGHCDCKNLPSTISATEGLILGWIAWVWNGDSIHPLE